MSYSRSEPMRNDSQDTVYELIGNYYACSQNSLRSQDSSTESSVGRNCMSDDEIIPSLVHEIIIDKFSGTLNRIKQRSIERRKSKKYFDDTYDELSAKQNRSDDSGLNVSSLDDFLETTYNKLEKTRTRAKKINKYSRSSIGNLQSKTISLPYDFQVSFNLSSSATKLNLPLLDGNSSL